MDKLQLLVRDFEKYRDGFPLWSIMYVKINNSCFPDDQWWDATSSVLEMWASTLVAFAQGYEDSCILDFMDGDYAIRLERLDTECIKAEFQKSGNTISRFDSIDLLHFIRQVLSATEKLKNCSPEILNTRMFERLLYEVNKLRIIK